MGKAAEVAGYGGSIARDCGTGDARAVRRRGRAARSAAEHTTARRRIRSGRAPSVAGPLSARRADEEQRAAAAEQVRERRAGVGGHGGGGGGGGGSGSGAAAGRARQKRRPAAEGHALVGAHGHAAPAALPAAAAALRHGPAPPPRSPRRVTPPTPTPPLPYHAYIPLSGRLSPECTRVPEYYRLGIYLLGTGPRPALPVICAKGRVVRLRTLPRRT